MRVLVKTALLLMTTAPVAAFGQSAQDLYAEGMRFKNAKQCSFAKGKFRDALQAAGNPVPRQMWETAGFELAWCLNELKEHVAAYETLLEIKQAGVSMAKVHFESGYAMEQLQRMDAAEKDYRKALQLKADYTQANKQLGNIAYSRKDYAGALREFAIVVAANKHQNDANVWYFKGTSELELARYADAKMSLRRATDLNPDNWLPWLQLGLAERRSGNFDAAVTHYQRAATLDPKEATPYTALGHLYREDLGKCPEAMQSYQRALQLKGADHNTRYGAGWCLNDAGKFADALPYLQQAVIEAPDKLNYQVEWAYSEHKLGKLSAAQDRLLGVLRRDPRYSLARNNLAMVYIDAGNRDEAKKLADEARRLGLQDSAATIETNLGLSSSAAPVAATPESPRTAVNDWGLTPQDFSLLVPDALLTKARLGSRAQEITNASLAGDANAMVLLGVARLYGIGMARDENQAAVLLRQAAELGHPRAMAGIAFILDNGWGGTAKNSVEARAWGLKGAQAGNAVAMHNLAILLETTRGGAKSEPQAAQWYQRAVDQGFTPSATRLAYMIVAGRGAPKDEALAASLWNRAALGGDIDATYRRAEMLLAGRGVAKDAVAARAHFQKVLDTDASYKLRAQSKLAVIESASRAAGARGDLVVLRFFSVSCQPCQVDAENWASAAIKQKIDDKGITVLNIDVDKEATMTADYQVTQVPTLVIFERGIVVNTIVGQQSPDRLMQALNAPRKP